jgi:hypothetical protein
MIIQHRIGGVQLYRPLRYDGRTPVQDIFVCRNVRSEQMGGVVFDSWCAFLFDTRMIMIESGLKGGMNEAIASSSDSAGSVRRFVTLYCSFVDGFDRGIRFPILYLLKTKYMLSQAAAFTAFGLALSPWLVKPLIALVTDTIPLFGFRRKPYLIGSALTNATSLGLMGYFTSSLVGGFMVPVSLLFTSTVCRCTTGSVIQGMLLEDCRTSAGDTTALISNYYTAHRLGQLVSVGACGYMLSFSSMTPIFLGMAACHIGTIGIAAFGFSEDSVRPIDDDQDKLGDLSVQFGQLTEFANSNSEFKSVLQYAFLTMLCPTYEARMFYFFLDDRHFTVWDVSLVTLAQTVGSTLAPSLYSYFFANSTRLFSLMRNLTLATVPVSLLPLLVSSGLWDNISVITEPTFAIITGFLFMLTTNMQLLPANIIVARSAKPGLEGSCFSLFTVVEGVGRVGSNLISGILPVLLGASAWNFYGNMSAYLVTTSAMQLIPLAVVAEDSDEPIHDVSPGRKPLLISSVPGLSQVFPLKGTDYADTEDENSYFDQEKIISA